ncbi:hypothetical protein SAMN05216269_11454 [Flavobacterium xinjiangense]|uniref:Uncharacterized protein n=1 Tax=Flavobacterium xinjiangense TaxID=178356 RepID=A0A1M7P7I3_9FLAO|nr:hypothetical protein SAMN05216269_11454 [Flavobacterium xinjiangense]
MKKSYFRKFFLSFEGSKNFQNNFSTYTVSETLPFKSPYSQTPLFICLNTFLDSIFSFNNFVCTTIYFVISCQNLYSPGTPR